MTDSPEAQVISGVLEDSYAQCARAYLYTGLDVLLTYFLLFHPNVIDQALNDEQASIRRKMEELRETRALTHPASALR